MIGTLLFFICALKASALKTIVFDNEQVLKGDFGFILDHREIRSRTNYFYCPFPHEMVTINELELQGTMKRRHDKIFIFDKLVPISHYKPGPPTLSNVREAEFDRGRFYCILPLRTNSPSQIYRSRIESDYAINITGFMFHSQSNTCTITKCKTACFDMSWCMALTQNPSLLIHQPIRCCNEILLILAELKSRGLSGNNPAPNVNDAIVVARDRMNHLVFKLVCPAVVGCKIDDFVQFIQAFKANLTTKLQSTNHTIIAPSQQ